MTLHNLNKILKQVGTVSFRKDSTGIYCHFFTRSNRIEYLFLPPFTKGRRKLLEFLNKGFNFTLIFSGEDFRGTISRLKLISPRHYEGIDVEINGTSIRAILREIGKLDFP